MSELGQVLQEARIKKGMSIEDLQNATKIQKRYLEYIEAGQFEKLPGSFYTRAFVKNYAEVVGLDSKEILETYQNEVPKPNNDEEMLPPRASKKTPPAKNRNREAGPAIGNLLPRIILICGIIVLGVLIWIAAQKLTSGNSEEPASTDPSHGATIETPTEADKAAPKEKSNKTKEKDQSDKNDQSEQPEQKPEASLSLTKTDSAVSYYDFSGADQMKLEVTNANDNETWVEIRSGDAKGTVVKTDDGSKASGIIKGGDSSFIVTNDKSGQLFINVGSAPNTSITVNGKPLELQKGKITQKVYLKFQETKQN